MQINNPSNEGFYNGLLLCPQFDKEECPYVFVKDKKGVALINTMKFEIRKMIDS